MVNNLLQERNGGRDMDNILKFIGLMGVVMVVSGTLVACNTKDVAVKDAATQIEVSTEVSTEATQENIEKLNQKVAEQQKEIESQIKKAESQFISEAKKYWNDKQAELSVCIENGLEYEFFENTYLLYRTGMETLKSGMSADTAYEFTYIEVDRLYGSEIKDYSALESDNFTIKENGDVEYNEQFAGALSMHTYFQGASQEEIDEFLKGFLPLCEGMSGQDIDLLLSMFDNSNLHAENETYNQSEGIVDSNSGNNNSSSSNNSNSGNSTPAYENPVVENPEDWNDSNPDTSVWGNANFNNDNHGGGERDITGATIGTP